MFGLKANQRTKASRGSNEKEMLSEDGLWVCVHIQQCCLCWVEGDGCVSSRRSLTPWGPQGTPLHPFCPLSLSWENCAFSIWGKRPTHRETWPVWGTPHPKTNYKHWQMAAWCTPLVLSRYNVYMHKSFSLHVFLQITVRINC